MRIATGLSIGLLLVAIACSKDRRGAAPPTPPPTPPTTPPVTTGSPTPFGFSTEPRTAQPRANLAPGLLPLLPQHGIYAAGGGLMSTPWRIVVELDGKGTAKLRSAKGDKHNGSSLAAMPEV